jgi:polyisoprenoid-binding protein YceI
MPVFTRMMALTATLFGSAVASAGEPAAIPDSDKSDYVIVYASHAEPKPTDPVSLRFEKVKVTKVKFAKPVAKGLDGASAQFEIDPGSLKSDAAKRDQHIKSPDYLDVAKFPTITVDVEKPRSTGKDRYKAPAKVSFRGKTYNWDVEFQVVETLPDGVRIRGEHKLTRKQLSLGKEAGDGVGQDLLIRLQLTLKQPAK